jgi:hypothetical protein
MDWLSPDGKVEILCGDVLRGCVDCPITRSIAA